jgi:hypothetical protein
MSVTTNTLGKINTAVSLFRSSIEEDKLNSDDAVHYYLGYLQGIIEETCKFDGEECGDLYLTQLYQEALRLKNSGDEGIYEAGREETQKALATPSGQSGIADGRIDGAYAANPQNSGPYFNKLVEKFAIRVK